ncbi:glycoside hydrolase family 25 protein [Streptosporangium saharense]|uniref:Lysozyme n=1 Tax=Streptosporangium saharense TaxID=1706840 RepID=A0A7W7VNM8_9ACTN|nr:glycoside hydrolase family 25 protein [Streptosporangium saharense]MBB4916813.1 lysozyme [Streptosporangium saharense]
MLSMLRGIDVSNWQGAVDWGEHADDGVAFAFAKATEGSTFTDRWFERNWTGMRENWIVCGAYHFARPTGDPEEQARRFLGTVERAGGLRHGDLLALDLETADRLPPRKVARFARAWCEAVTARAGVRPVIYTYLSFAYEGNCAGLEDHPLWIAAPDHPTGRPEIPDPWNRWTIHQYSHKPLDRNVFRGTRTQLTSLGYRPRRRAGKRRDRDR